MSFSVLVPAPGELVINAPSHAIEEFVKNCECEGISVQRGGSSVSNADRPEPMVEYEWDWDAEDRLSQQSTAGSSVAPPPPPSAYPDATPVHVVNEGSEGGLGLPEYYFGQDAVKASGSTQNSVDEGDKPTPMPEFEWPW
jgi:hypothetical protein